MTSLIPGENGKILQNIASEYYTIAQKHAELKEYDKAIANYTLAARSAEFRKPARYQIARMYALSSKWPEAEKAFKNLLREDPDNTDLASSLAYVTAQGGGLDEAEDLYRILAEKNPHNEQLLENYIRTLAANNKTENAASQTEVFAGQFPQSAVLAALQELVKPPEPEKSAEETGEGEEKTGGETEKKAELLDLNAISGENKAQ
jgi:tetratricopeptide (TPR) repeat protein